jgi:hypothetical protein
MDSAVEAPGSAPEPMVGQAGSGLAGAFIYLRYYPGFTDIVPYGRINPLPDADVLSALRQAIEEQRQRQTGKAAARPVATTVDEIKRRHKRRIMIGAPSGSAIQSGKADILQSVGHEIAHSDRTCQADEALISEAAARRLTTASPEYRKRMKSNPDLMRREGVAGLLKSFMADAKFRERLRRDNPSLWERIRDAILPSDTKSQATPFEQLANMAKEVGWHSGAGDAVCTEFLISPRIWIARVESTELAARVVKKLGRLKLVVRDEYDIHQTLNPRYGFVSADDLSSEGREDCFGEIVRLWTGKTLHDWERPIRELQGRIDECFQACRAELDRETSCEPVAEVRHTSGIVSGRGMDAPDAERTSAPAGVTRFEWLAKAMLLVLEHPDWSDAKIAREVHKHPSTLSRSREYKESAKMARVSIGQPPKGHITATASSKLRDVEAVDHRQPHFDDKSDHGQPIPGSKYFREYCSECDESIKVTKDQVGQSPRCDRCGG